MHRKQDEESTKDYRAKFMPLFEREFHMPVNIF